jgi:hypothetical protein
MGVKRQWKIKKLTELAIDPEVRQQLITDIMRRKSPRIRLYAWDVHTGTAKEAFFDQKNAVKNWYVNNRLWEQEECPKGVLLYEWAESIDQILKHSNETHIKNIPISSAQKIHVAISPSSLHEDMQRTLKNQG